MRGLGADKKREFCLSFRGRTTRVLVEEKMDSKTGRHRGFSRNYLPVMVRAGDQYVNREVDVEVHDMDNGWLIGRLTKQDFQPELAPRISANV